MSILTGAFNPRPKAEGWEPGGALDNFWYTKDLSGYVAERDGGVGVGPETMLRCSTVWAAVKFKAVSWAMCPPSTYRKTPRGRVEEPKHASQLVLRNPNAWQTGWRWRALMSVWMSTYGNAFCKAVAGPRSFADELRPLHPSVCRVKDQREDGSLLYQYTPRGLPQELLGSEQVLHFQDLSTDGFSGLAMYRLIRNVVSIALLAERHEEAFLKKGTRVAGLIVPAAALKAEDRQALKDSLNADFGGPSQTGMLGILPHGVDLKPLSLGARVEQRAELTDQNIGSILRFLGVPGVVVGWQGDKASTYASAKEFFESGGIKHCILPILTNVEAEEDKFLLRVGDGLYIRHNVDVLSRGNLKDRYDAYSKALGGAPFLSVNDVRTIEDYEIDADPRHDEIRIPGNMLPPAAAPEPAVDEPADTSVDDPPPHDDGGQANEAARAVPAPVAAAPDGPALALVRKYAHDNGARVARREVDAIASKATKYAQDRAGWKAFVLAAYEKHASYVSEVMHIELADARAYCTAQASALLAGGAVVAQNWEAEIPPRLVAVALGERAA